LNQQKGNWE